MKNKYMKYGAVVCLMLLFGSCNDAFLERYPLDQISNETYWNTENDLLNYNNGLYGILRDDQNYPIMMGLGPGAGVRYYTGIWWQDEMSDNLGANNARALEFYQIRCGNWTVQNDPRPTGWTGWNVIRNINFGLANYDRAPIDPKIINKYKGEARLFRGWFYAEKVSKFGGVQWVDKVLNIDDDSILYGKRDSRDYVMDKVLADLDFACTNLPADWGNGQNPGRVTKWAALAVKSRICLFEGTWRKYHGLANADKWLTACVAASKELMDNGGFTLYNTGHPGSDYRYRLSSQTQEGNPEVIYWRKYEVDINSHFASRLFLNYNGGATKSFVEDVLCNDGKPITLSDKYAGDAKIEDVFVNRDLRLRQCVLAPEDQTLLTYCNDATHVYPQIVGMAGAHNTSNTGYHVVKHWNYADELMPRDQHTCSPPDLTIGEVYLNYAEAKADLGTITQADLDMSINKLRDRVAMPHLMMNPPMDPRYANDGVSSTMVEIRRERRVELFLEGKRYNDIRRWKQGPKFAQSDYGIRWDAAAIARYKGAKVKSTLINGVPYIDVRLGTPYVPVWDDKMYLWPIPVNAISQNPNLVQTPGWQ